MAKKIKKQVKIEEVKQPVKVLPFFTVIEEKKISIGIFTDQQKGLSPRITSFLKKKYKGQLHSNIKWKEMLKNIV